MIPYLYENNLVDPKDVKVFHKGTRDNSTINVMKCSRTGMLFLDKIEKSGVAYYKRLTEWQSAESKDNQRRADKLRSIVANKKWADIGSGSRGLSTALRYVTRCTTVEPDRTFPGDFRLIDKLSPNTYDVITLMHSFEHFEEPIESLKEIRVKMKQSGIIFIEVPHAKNFLIEVLDNLEFKNFTFWSDHLILHTRETLTKFLELAGFENVIIEGIQRYSLGNQIGWLLDGLPGGDNIYHYLNYDPLDSALENVFQKIDMTDTLWASATS